MSATMSKASLMQLVILTTLISLFANNVSSQPQPPIRQIFQTKACNVNVSDEYSAGSPYDTNLRTLLAALEQQANSTKFYSTSSGTTPDTVYGQYYCRGDISTTLCGACVQAAVRALTCFPSKGGTLFISECTLGYSDRPMFGVLETEAPRAEGARGNVSDTQQSYAALTTTLTGLIAEAVNVNVNGGRPSLFATSGNGSTVYGLVQCSPDLSRTQCETCLRSIYDDRLPKCCGQRPTTWFSLNPSCQMRYSTEGLFYYDPPLAPPPLAVSSPPSPPPASPVLTGSQPPTPSTFSAPPPINSGSEVVGSSRKMMGIAIAAFVILLICI